LIGIYFRILYLFYSDVLHTHTHTHTHACTHTRARAVSHAIGTDISNLIANRKKL